MSYSGGLFVRGQSGAEKKLTASSALPVMEHSATLEVRDFLLGIVEIVAKDFGVVLAQEGGLEIEGSRKFGEAQSETGHIKIAEHAIVHLSHRTAFAEVRMVNRFFNR